MNDYLQLRKIPLLRILVPYVLGIITMYAYFDHLKSFFLIMMVSAFVIITVLILVLFIKLQTLSFDVLVMLFLFDAGLCCTFATLNTQKIPDTPTYFQGIVNQEPQLKKNSICLSVKLTSGTSNDGISLFRPRLILYTEKDSSLFKIIKSGDRVLFFAQPSRIKNLGNPGEFNYEKYLAIQHVFYQTYVPKNNLVILSANNKFGLYNSINFIRKRITDQLNKYPFSKDNYAIILALIAGNRDLISDDLEQSYINAGVVHVLSVSGLHIGIIFMFLQIVLKFMDYHKRTRFLKITILLSVIWLYAIISSLSPSVVRASLMFSLITIGNSLRRDISSYNILALAAFIMLIINPMQLFDVGLQLSFLAIFGILYFQPIFDKWLWSENKFLDYLYKLFTVSLSAQLATFPLTLYYFHQFPNYFWLANLLVIPLSFVVLIMAVVYIIVASVPYIGFFIGWMLNTSTSIMNGWITRVENIPGAIVERISIHGFLVLSLFAVILLLFSWLKKPKVIKIYALVVLLIAISINGIVQTISRVRAQDAIYVLNAPKTSIIAVHSHSMNCYYGSFSKDSLPQGVQKLLDRFSCELKLNKNIDYYQIGNLALEKLRNSQYKYLNVSAIDIGGIPKILFYPGNYFDSSYYHELSADFMIVSGNLFPPKQAVLAKTIILDSSNKPYIEKYWSRYCQKWSKKLVIVRLQGAYKISSA